MSNKNGSLVITPEELKERSIEGLALRPNSSNLTGDAPLTGEQLRARIGALPKLLAERFNELLTNMGMGEGNSVADGIKITAAGTETERTLQEWINILFADSTYLSNIENELKLIAGGQTKTLLGWIEFLDDKIKDLQESAPRKFQYESWEAVKDEVGSNGSGMDKFRVGDIISAGGINALVCEITASTNFPRLYDGSPFSEGTVSTAWGRRKLSNLDACEYATRSSLESVKALAQGKSRGRSYASWAEIISALRGYATNTAAKKDFAVGDSLFTVDASADAWVSGFADTSSFPTAPASGKDPFGDGSTVQVGFLILAKADGKTDLSGYVKNTDVATPSKAGLVKVGSGLSVADDGTVSVKEADASACANALYGTKSGEQILSLRDISPLAHSVELRAMSKNGATVTGSTAVTVQGKNLLPYPYGHTTQTVSGIRFTDNGDGSITINGTAESSAAFNLFVGAMPVDGIYTISGLTGGSGSSYYIQPFTTDAAHGGVTDGSRTYEWTNTVLTRLVINIAIGATVNNVVVRPMLEIGSAATDYEPYILPTQTDVPFGQEVLLPVRSPSMTISADRPDAMLTVSYQRDLNQAFRSVASKTEALLMKDGERGFGFAKLPSAIGTHTAEDEGGSSVSLTLADSEDGFAMTVDVYSPTMQGGNLSLRIPIATFETESGKRYTIPALPDKTSNNESCDLYYSVGGTAMKGNYIVSPDLDNSGAECGYYGAQEYLSDGGIKTLYLNFYSSTPYRASEVLSLLSERTVTLPLPDMGYEIAVTEEKTYTAQTSLSAIQHTLTLSPIENGVHVSCTHSVDTLGDSFSFEVPIANIKVHKGLYYTVPAMPENTANNYNNGAHFKVELGGVTKAMTENYHPTDDESGEWGELGNFGADNFQATATGTATLYLVLSYTAGNSDNVTTDFDLIFPMIATSGNITLSPESGTEYRLDVATAATLQLAFPKGIGSDSIYKSVIRFDTAVAIPSVSYPNTFVFAGDGVTSGVFAPVTKKRYCVTLDYDGEKILGKVAEYPV